MAEFHIRDEDLAGLKGKIAIVTGSSSGIGLATVELLISQGATVVGGDVQIPPTTSNFTFVHTDVTRWADLTRIFKTAKDKHGRIDYVFANAGIGPRANYLTLEVDENGELKEPNNATLRTNLDSVVSTTTLAAHYMKTQSDGGSIVLMGSSTGLHAVRAVDYGGSFSLRHTCAGLGMTTSQATAKSGVIGFGRSFARLVEAAGLPIRVNTLAPSWTATQVLPDLKNLLAAVSQDCQPTSVVARAAAYLMANSERQGETVFVCDGRFYEIEKAVLSPAYDKVKGNSLSNDSVLAKVLALGS